MRYKHAVLGGTFDRLHSGHKKLIKSAAEESQKVTIGLTVNEMAGRKNDPYPIQDFETRKAELLEYLDSINAKSKTRVAELSDIYGPAVFEEDVDVLFATDSTRGNALKVIDARFGKGLSKLELVIVEETKAGDGGALSSKRIRSGEIDRDGNSYLSLLKKSPGYLLPENMREELKKPFGEVIGEKDFEELTDQDVVITVGDVATAKVMERRITPILSIFDLKSNRNPIEDNDILSNLPSEAEEVENPPATISAASIDAIGKAFALLREENVKSAVKTIGEEDLLTIPCVLLAPLGSTLIYGLSGVGGIKINIEERKKAEFVGILARLNHN